MCVCVSGVIALGACPAAAAGDDVEVDNPFHEAGELRRKADFIITHSRISRTQLTIADPDHDSVSTMDLRATDHTDTPPTAPPPESQTRRTDTPQPAAPSQSPAASQQQRRHDDQATVVKVTSAVTSPLRAETVRINRKRRCVVQ